MSEWSRKQAKAISDIHQRIADLDKKLDVILRSCCSHSRRVAGHKSGDPVVCEDCGTVVGHVS